MKVLVIIPAYNEEGTIEKLCKSIEKLNQNLNFELDYVVINDCSNDKTYDICTKNNFPTINLINNLGIGGAVQTGYKYAVENEYDIAIQVDGDGQHDINYIEKLVTPIIDSKCNMTIGSRYVQDVSDFKSTKMRQMGIKMLSFVLKITTGKKIYDVTSGFRAVDKNIMQLFASYYPHDYPEPETLELVIKKGYKVKEIAVKMNKRESGRSSITSFKSIYYMLKVTYAMLITSILERRAK